MDERRAIKSLVRVGSAVMAAWTDDELQRIGDAEELQIAPRAPRRHETRPTTIWVVRVGDDLYVRVREAARSGLVSHARASGAGADPAGGVEKDVTFDDAAVAALRRDRCRLPREVRPTVREHRRQHHRYRSPRDHAPADAQDMTPRQQPKTACSRNPVRNQPSTRIGVAMSEVVVVIGAGSIGQAIARRVSAGKHVVLADLRQRTPTRRPR